MTGLHVEQAAGIVAERLLNGIPAGIVIALAAWIVLRLVGRKNSSTRFAVWFSAMVAIGAAPLVASLHFGTGVERSAAITVPSFWGEVLLSLWAVIACLALVRVAIGLWGLLRLRARHKRIDPAVLDPMIQRTVAEFGLSRKVTLAISDELRVPTAIGFFRPMVILPRWVLAELSQDELNAIVIHELAHLRRWDDCTNLAQKILRAIFFFNPAVCWIEHQLSLEREMACDDVVLSRTANPLAYAQCLVAVAEKSFVRRGLALAQAAVSRMRQTSRRVTQILDADRPGAIRVWKPAFALVTIVSAGSLVTLTRTPELISFQQSSSVVAMAAKMDAPQPAMLIPATFHPSRAAMLAPGSQRAPRLKLRQAARRKVTPREPMVVLASAPSQDEAPPQTVFVVWHEFDSNGWTVCIWRVTFIDSKPSRTAIPAKSI